MPKDEPTPVDLDNLIAAEFDYIAQTAIQANEDRARVSSFYLIAVGSLVAALFGTQFFDPNFFTPTINLTFSGLFILLTLLGTSTILQLARLRTAWHESALAMNQLKDYMMSQNESLIKAFLWKTGTLPDKFKANSVSYYQAVEVALISGLTLSAAAYFVQQAFFSIGVLHWIISVLIGIFTFFLQMFIYKRTL